jgi:PAS domain S-box-containing protein
MAASLPIDQVAELELFFSQSLDGFFFMMMDEPIRWDDTVDREAVLEYVFDHQRMTKVNDAMLHQYGTSREKLLGATPRDLFSHDVEHGKDLWRRMLNAGRLHVESDERRADGSRMWITSVSSTPTV